MYGVFEVIIYPSSYKNVVAVTQQREEFEVFAQPATLPNEQFGIHVHGHNNTLGISSLDYIYFVDVGLFCYKYPRIYVEEEILGFVIKDSYLILHTPYTIRLYDIKTSQLLDTLCQNAYTYLNSKLFIGTDVDISHYDIENNKLELQYRLHISGVLFVDDEDNIYTEDDLHIYNGSVLQKVIPSPGFTKHNFTLSEWDITGYPNKYEASGCVNVKRKKGKNILE